MIRVIISLALATVVTFALLAFMTSLVTFGEPEGDKRKKSPHLVINPEKFESETKRKVRFKPRLPPPESPPRPRTVQPDPIDSTNNITFNLPAVKLDNRKSLVNKPSLYMMQEGDATPIFRIEPRYPSQAAREGIEGYVVLSFSINTIGGPIIFSS